jgi:hypothetical protein
MGLLICVGGGGTHQSRKLKSAYGARNRFQEPSLELSSQAIHRLAGQYENPMPIWFLAPIAGLKLPTLYTTQSSKCLYINLPHLKYKYDKNLYLPMILSGR